ncbi:rhodanese-like domain-containing protein [Shouchella lonarensis]|uniref:Rhodanese-related sulfurtransferase n=1 Tax=Shouchella lonarensis TaxID=1464122 RepID=A0A1G6GJU9_9BACI|nr:rhodanese-like domain-containing protein [Shouchella lonarensis]SDB82214.1 Rhodanese-related sulfurtransferase [Shouchella lonarensis]
MSKSKDGIVQVSTDGLKELMQNPDRDIVLIDVREVDEYEEGHIPGVPLIPMSVIEHHVAHMEQEKSYVLICRSGGRSQRTAQFMKEKGFADVRNYDGGMLAWDGEQAIGAERVIVETEELYQ